MDSSSIHSNCFGASHGRSKRVQRNKPEMWEAERHQSAGPEGARLARHQHGADRPHSTKTPSHHNLRAAAVSVYTIGPPNSPHSYAAAPGIASYASYSPYARTQRRERYALPPVFEGFTPIPYSTPVATMSQTQHAPNGLPTVKSKRKNKKQQQDLEQQPLLYENGMINLQPLTLFGKRQPVDPARKKTSSRMVSLRTKQGKSSKKKESTVVHLEELQKGSESEMIPDMTTVWSSPSSSAFRYAGHESETSDPGYGSESVQITSARDSRRSVDTSFLAQLLDTDAGEGEGEHRARSAPVSCLKKRSDDSDVTAESPSQSSDSSSRPKSVRFVQIPVRSPSPSGSESPSESEASPRLSAGDHAEDQFRPHITATSSGSLRLCITGKKKKRSGFHSNDALNHARAVPIAEDSYESYVIHSAGSPRPRSPPVTKDDSSQTPTTSEACLSTSTQTPDFTVPSASNATTTTMSQSRESPRDQSCRSPSADDEEGLNAHSVDQGNPSEVSVSTSPEAQASPRPGSVPTSPTSSDAPHLDASSVPSDPNNCPAPTSPRMETTESDDQPPAPAAPHEKAADASRSPASPRRNDPQGSPRPHSSADIPCFPVSTRPDGPEARPFESEQNNASPVSPRVLDSSQHEYVQCSSSSPSRYPSSALHNAAGTGPQIPVSSLSPSVPSSQPATPRLPSSPREAESSTPAADPVASPDASVPRIIVIEKDELPKGRHKGGKSDKGNKWDDRMHIWLTQTAWKQDVKMD